MISTRMRGLWTPPVVLALFAVLGGAACGSEGGDIQLTNVEPRAGTLGGDQAVKITGANFRTDIGYTVYFGNKKATSVTIRDESTIIVTTPSMDDPQTVDVVLSADNGPAFKIAQAFTFEDRSEDAAAAAAAEKRGNLAY